ncbi:MULTISPECIES: ribokinase [Dyella]|uniref:Ribokinase n=2 Tax=Dyella TaxID=231454 RepID=A0A4R0YQQ3_9GAMM|nr:MULTISPECIES: ribokinase [Dyella]TBR36746.1 ribokinase [Dyella terrae]TCI08163.1 ribokinase [Dyella soli]
MTSPRTGTVLVAGSANLDFVVRATHVPAPGETVLGRDFGTFPGGKGANQAAACAKAGGASTQMLVALGYDVHAQVLEASLIDAGVVMRTVRSNGPTGVAFVCLSDTAENAITVAPGANNALLPEHLPPLHNISHLLMQLESPLPSVLAWARAARGAGVVTVLNAAPAQALPDELIALIDVLIVNEHELAQLTGLHDIDAALDRLTNPCVVVTLGAQGSRARMHGEHLHQPAFAITPVDTTGAGDTFCGTLVAALCRGLPFAEALRHASAASALACTRLGAQAGIPTAREVNDLLASHPSP